MRGLEVDCVQSAPAVRRSPCGLAFDVIDLVPPWHRPGPPVVFVHGIGASRGIWADWLPLIAVQHPVLRFDLRGFGDSAALAETVTMTPTPELMALLIDDLMEVIDAAGFNGPVHLVGESAGGTVVLAAAVRHAVRVASVTISNAAFVGAGIGQIHGWQDLFAAGGVAAWSARMMECRFAPGELDLPHAAWFASQQERTVPEVALRISAMLAQMDLTAELAMLQAPLLILAPTASPFVPLAMAEQLQHLVSGATLRVFSDARHGLPFSHAQACAQALQNFLQSASSLVA